MLLRRLARIRDRKMLFLHAVQQAGDIRIAGNHPFGDAPAQKSAAGLCAAEDTKNVVLRGGKATGFDDLLGTLGEEVRGLHQCDEEVGLQVRGRAGCLRLRIHQARL